MSTHWTGKLFATVEWTVETLIFQYLVSQPDQGILSSSQSVLLTPSQLWLVLMYLSHGNKTMLKVRGGLTD